MLRAFCAAGSEDHCNTWVDRRGWLAASRAMPADYVLRAATWTKSLPVLICSSGWSGYQGLSAKARCTHAKCRLSSIPSSIASPSQRRVIVRVSQVSRCANV